MAILRQRLMEWPLLRGRRTRKRSRTAWPDGSSIPRGHRMQPAGMPPSPVQRLTPPLGVAIMVRYTAITVITMATIIARKSSIASSHYQFPPKEGRRGCCFLCNVVISIKTGTPGWKFARAYVAAVWERATMRSLCAWASVLLSLCYCLVLCDGCLDQERAALLDISSELLLSADELDWSNRDCCRWERVTCNSRTGRVTGLNLGGAGYAHGLFNATLFLPFQELQNLSLSGFEIQGCIPGAGFKVWSNLHKLDILDLSGNRLTDRSISSLVGLSSLRSLFLNDNFITSALIILRLSKTKLRVIDLSGNIIVGNLPRAICNMTSLQELRLHGNLFSGELPSCIRNLTSLKVLDLSYNLLTVRFPSLSFANMTSLVQLSLSNNQLEGLLFLSSFANHLQLKYLGLSSNSTNFQVRTENSAANISTRLQVLELSNCNLNGNSGVMPSFLLHQHNLRLIDMSSNNLSGYFPAWLMEKNIHLSALNLRKNSFVGPLVLPSKVNENLSWLDASCNMLNKELPMKINITFPNLSHLNLSRNSFRGVLPSAFSYLENLTTLDLSYNNISDEIAASSIGTLSKLSALFLSGNSFHGSLPQIHLANMYHLVVNDNNISGEIPTSICNMFNQFTVVDISNNRLTGSLPSCIGQLDNLYILNLRENHISGSIPMELCYLPYLQFLDLSKNLLSGPIPSLPNLTYVHLSENNFNGTFPLALSLNANLKTIDLRYNQLEGEIPSIIAEAFPELRVLLLKGNMFEGMIPDQICDLKYVRLLDLSNNMLSDHIPSCLSNMGLYGDFYSFKYGDHGDPLDNVTDVVENFQQGFNSEVNDTLMELDQEEFTTKGRKDYYKGNILDYMSGLDFSSNQLKGSIPESIGNMKWLRALNFSNNYLDGSIPKSLSNLSNLESLDLSHNNLTGQIPPELVALQSLEVFSVAYNNLSGPTPGTKGQFITFDQGSYEGNRYLCGLPLLKSCAPAPLVPHPEEHEEDDDKVGDIILFGCSALFYAVGFWTSLAVLYFKRSWRWSWFLAVDRFSDKLAIFTTKIGISSH